VDQFGSPKLLWKLSITKDFLPQAYRQTQRRLEGELPPFSTDPQAILLRRLHLNLFKGILTNFYRLWIEGGYRGGITL
jgi:hypothetical protein